MSLMNGVSEKIPPKLFVFGHAVNLIALYIIIEAINSKCKAYKLHALLFMRFQ